MGGSSTGQMHVIFDVLAFVLGNVFMVALLQISKNMKSMSHEGL